MADHPGGQLLHRYASVSSLYGPGTVACWYLTLVSVLVSWTLHPEKRKSGSVDADMIAVLTLPAVAAGHLISQVSGLVHGHETGPSANVSATAARDLQSVAAVEAPFSLVESFMPISVFLFLLAVWAFCLRRALAVALVGLLCLAAECYVHFSSFSELGMRYRPSGSESDASSTFSRSFVADFAGLVVAILLILCICAVAASVLVTYTLQPKRTLSDPGGPGRRRPDENPEPSREAAGSSRSMAQENLSGMPRMEPSLTRSAEGFRQGWERAADESRRAARVSAWVSLAFLPSTLLLSVMPSMSNAASFGYQTTSVAMGGTVTLWSRLKVFANHFYPRSGSSFSDLDQAVTTMAGATVLGLSIYSVAKARVDLLRTEQAMQVEGNRTEPVSSDQD